MNKHLIPVHRSIPIDKCTIKKVCANMKIRGFERRLIPSNFRETHLRTWSIDLAQRNSHPREERYFQNQIWISTKIKKTAHVREAHTEMNYDIIKEGSSSIIAHISSRSCITWIAIDNDHKKSSDENKCHVNARSESGERSPLSVWKCAYLSKRRKFT